MRFPLFSWFFSIFFCSVLLGIDVDAVWGQCLKDQSSLLLQLKGSLTFNSSTSTKLVKWNSSSNCSDWVGVTWDADRVIGLDLSNESITGGIGRNSSLFGLGYLQRLNFADNRFNFTDIPASFEKLANLTYLNLSNAGFGGQIPIEISRMARLVILDLSTVFPGTRSLKLENPNLKGLVRNLTELKELHLDGVNISAQRHEWCQAISSSLPNLQVLSLSNCYLSGPIDSSLQKLQSLSVIHLSQNNFSTSVPEFFANFPNLTSLYLSSCGLNGTLPPKIFQVPKLQALDLSNNKLLHGSLPELPKNGSLHTLVLGYTNFSGELPDSIGKLEMLTRIELNDCNFSGTIPSTMADLSQLVYLDLSSNKFTGSIPSLHMSKNLTHIDFSHNNLRGAIASTHWELLENLAYIDLRDNSFNGSIPSSLFSLPSLQKIQLSSNQFDGQVEFSNANSSLLDTLDLSSNKLYGPFPMSLFELKSLNILSVSSNEFSGNIHLDMICRLRNLTSLNLSYNKLSINVSIDRNVAFPRITTLKLASCNLKAFPDLKNQSRLVYLDLSNNQINSEIPNWIWNIGNGSLLQLNLSHNLLGALQEPYLMANNLTVLDLHHNHLRGQIPAPPPSASYVDYSSNHFNSSIPTDIGNNLTIAVFFSLSSNNVTGIIPDSICNATYLEVLDLSNNSLSGTIPSCLIERMETLGVLNLQRNKLQGISAKKFQGNCNLKTLDLSKNLLQGQIPKSLANCTALEVLNLGINNISDAFPCWLKNVPNLRVLVLRSNRFYGNIHCRGSNNSWPNLQIIDLASNNFSGALSSTCLLKWKAMMSEDDEVQSELNHLRFGFLQLSNLYYQDAVTVTIKGIEMELVKILTIFTSIDLSNNSFRGSIPETIGNLTSLHILNLSHNTLTEKIPASLGNLKQLESLDLSWNKLSGEIPTQFASLTFLSALNLSYNQLVGAIPEGNQFQTFTETSFLGNKGLCGRPLKNKSCQDHRAVPPSSSSHTSHELGSNSVAEFDWKFIITGLGFGVGAGMVLAPLMFWKKGRKWYDQNTTKCLLMIFPSVGFLYTGCDDGRVVAEETTETELAEITGEFDDDDDEDEDETEDKAFRGRFCVFCSKLDISRKKVIHNPECSCHDSPLISSSSSSSSSSS